MGRLLSLILCRPPRPSNSSADDFDESLVGYPYPADIKAPITTATSSSSLTLPLKATLSTTAMGSPSPNPNLDTAILTRILTASKQDLSTGMLARDINALVTDSASHTSLPRDKASIASWYSSLAQRLLDNLERLIRESDLKTWGSALKEAYEKAYCAAGEFVNEHPVYAAVIATVIAIGVLALISVWAVRALGFGLEGIGEGTWAAAWQSAIGDVEAGSFFTYLQRLGMTFKILPKAVGVEKMVV